MQADSLLDNVWDIHAVSRYINSTLREETGADRVSTWLIDGVDVFVCVNDAHDEPITYEPTYMRNDIPGYYVDGSSVTQDIKVFDYKSTVLHSMKNGNMVSEKTKTVYETPLTFFKKFIGFMRVEVYKDSSDWLEKNQENIEYCGDLAANTLGKVLKYNEVSRQMAQRNATAQIEIKQNGAVLKLSTDGFLFTDSEGVIVEYTDTAKKLFGYSGKDLIGMSLMDVAPELVDGEGNLLNDRPNSKYSEVTCYKRDGGTFLSAVSSLRVDDTTRITWAFRDITALHKTKQKLEVVQQELQNDALTGAMARQYCMDKLHQSVAFAQDCNASTVIAVADIDKFKSVNDTYGHPVGDIVLKRVAEAMSEAARSTDLVGRVGGEEFLIVMPQTAAEQAPDVLERIRNSVANCIIKADGNTINVTVSIGYDVCYEVDEINNSIKSADQAMYRSKQSGRNRVTCASDPQMGLFAGESSNH